MDDRIDGYWKPRILVAWLFASTLLVHLSLAANANSQEESYFATLPSRTVIVANLSSDDSVELARFYAKQRSIPLANIIYINCPDTETISWKNFVEKVFNPIQVDLVSRAWIRGKILPETDAHGRYKIQANQLNLAYLVTTRGVPVSIQNAPDEILKDSKFDVYSWDKTHNSKAALDTELSLLAVDGSPIVSVVLNPYFQRQDAHLASDFVVKTSRIDGPDLEICKRIITDSIEAEKNSNLGRGFVDLGGPFSIGDEWLKSVFETLSEKGVAVAKEESKSLAGDESDLSDLSFYFGWYSGRIGGAMTTDDANLLPGSIAFHIHSFSGKVRSFEEGWTGPLLAKGASVSVGNVNEPYLELTHRPDLLIEALREGWNIGDAMMYALPMLSWQAMHIGDPLYRPFLNKDLE